MYVPISVSWSAVCLQGLVRMMNQDNLVIPAGNLPIIHTDFGPLNGVETPVSSPAVFAVFDGLGGESGGEYASYLAADYLNNKLHSSSEGENFSAPSPAKELTGAELTDYALEMNALICSNQKAPRRHMGTTLALIAFHQNNIICENIGDSRIYRFADSTLTQISRDHVPASAGIFSNTLTQYLGIPETEFSIEPEIRYMPVQPGDIYLICSDGLTKMLSDERITRILSENRSLEESVMALREVVLKKGAEDNVTIILCKVESEKEGV